MQLSLDKILSLIIVMICLFMMGAWIFGQQYLYPIFPHIFQMTFNTALCFNIATIPFLLTKANNEPNKICQTIVGCLLCIFSSLFLFEHLTQISIGIDQFFVKSIVNNAFLNPGRISPIASLAFLILGSTLCILPRIHEMKMAYTVHVCILGIVIIGLIGLVGSFLQSLAFFDWYTYGQMSSQTSFCFILISIALWIVWYRTTLKFKIKLGDLPTITMITLTLFVILILIATTVTASLVR